METQPHISIGIEPGTTGGDLLDRILTENGITTESVIAGMGKVANEILTPEFVELNHTSGFLFECTPEGRAEASKKRAEWYANN